MKTKNISPGNYFIDIFAGNTNENYSSKTSLQQSIYQTRQRPGRLIKLRVVIITPLLIVAGILIASIRINDLAEINTQSFIFAMLYRKCV